MFRPFCSGFTGTIPARALTLLILLAAACSRTPSGSGSFSRRLSEIDSLRAEGRYGEALESAGRLRRKEGRPGGRRWHLDETDRLEATLSRIIALPPACRADMAIADSLTFVIRRFMEVDEDLVAAAEAATRQYEARTRCLGPDDPETAASLDLLGQIAYEAGEGAMSETYLDAALQIRREKLGPGHPLVSESLEHLGLLFKEHLDHKKATACYREALAILEAAYPPDDPALAPALQATGSYYRLLRRFDEGEKLYERALSIRRRAFGPRSREAAENLLWLGHCRLCAGKVDEAERSLKEARDILAERHMYLSHPMGDTQWFLGMAAWLKGDCAGAVELWREAFRCQTNTETKQPVGYGLRRLRGLVPEYVDALLCCGRAEEAWEEVCRETGPVARSLLNFSVARQLWEEDARRLDSLRTEVVAVRRRLDLTTRAGDWTPGSPAADSLLVRLARADAERTQLEQKLIVRLSEIPGEPMTLARLQGALRPDQAMVGWVQGQWNWAGRVQKYSVWAYVVRNEGNVHWVHLGTWRSSAGFAEWTESSTRYRKTVLKASQWPERVPADPELDHLSSDVWKKVFRPLMPYLSGARDLVIVDGRCSPLSPWDFFPECLIDSEGVRLNDRFAFSYTPSPVVFVRLDGSSPGRSGPGPRSIVAVADPLGPAEPAPDASGDPLQALFLDPTGGAGTTALAPSVFRSVLSGDPTALDRLPRLPCSRAEVASVASNFHSATVLVGPDATRPSLERALGSAGKPEVLHLATHALIDEAEGGRSALIVSAGRDPSPAPAGRGTPGMESDAAHESLITAEEVLLRWKLNADLVTLSGCRTGRGTSTRGGEDLGFQQAFLAAGARSIVMSRWPVDDRATALLMSRFYENLTGHYGDIRLGAARVPLAKTRALEEARTWLRNFRDGNGNAPFSNPVYWAGFVLAGNPD